MYAGLMDVEKAYDRVDRQGLRMYGVGEKLFKGIKSFYITSR